MSNYGVTGVDSCIISPNQPASYGITIPENVVIDNDVYFITVDLTQLFGSDANIMFWLGLTSLSDLNTISGNVKAVSAFEHLFPQEYYAHHTSASGDLTLFNFSNPQTFRTFARSNKCKTFLKI